MIDTDPAVVASLTSAFNSLESILAWMHKVNRTLDYFNTQLAALRDEVDNLRREQ